MSLSNKKIKYIKNTASQKTIKDLSLELNVSEKEVEEVLKDNFNTSNVKPISINSQGETVISFHTVLIFVVAILIFFVPLNSKDPSYYDFANLAQEVYVQSISGFIVFIWLLDCSLARNFEIKKCSLYLPILGLVIWSFISLSWTTNIPESMDVISQWVACSVIFFVVYNMIKSPLDVSILMAAVFCSLIYLVLIGFIQFFDNTFSLYNQVISPAGTFGNKNMFSDYLVITLPICFYFFAFGTGKTRLFLQIFSAVVFLGGVILITLSKTRAGIVTFPLLFIIFISGLIYLNYQSKNQLASFIFTKQKIIILGVFTVLFPVILALILNFYEREGFTPADFKNRINSIFKFPDQDKKALNTEIKDTQISPVSDSTTIRWIAWRNTIEMIKDKPFTGFGLNNWQIHYADYRRAYYNDPTYQPGLILAQVHNDFLQLAVELGLIGFGLFAWFIIGLIVFFIKIFRSKTDSTESKLKALSILICLIGFGFACFFSFLIVKGTPTLLLFLYGALLANLYYDSDLFNTKNKTKFFPFSPTIASLALIPVFSIAVWVTKEENKRIKADQLFKTANDNFTNQKFDAVIPTCLEILELTPNLNKTHFILANAYMSTNQFDNAIKHMEIGLKYYPNDLMGLFQIGTIYIRQLKSILESNNPNLDEIKKLEDKTIFWYNKAFAIRNDFSKAWNNLGFLYERKAYRLQKQGNTEASNLALDESEKCFDNAMASDGFYSDAILNKANILIEKKNYQLAGELAMKVLKNTYKKYQDFDTAYQNLIDKNFQKSTGVFSDAINKRAAACQEYLNSGSKSVALLRVIYSRTNQIEKLFEVFEFERNILIQKVENQRAKYETAVRDYELAKENPAYIRQGMVLEQYQNYANTEKKIKDDLDKEAFEKIAFLLIESSEAHKIVGRTNESILSLQKVIDLSKTKDIHKEATYARLKMNELYLSVGDQNLSSKLAIIEENFEKASFTGDKELNQYKEHLLTRYNQIKPLITPK